MPGRLVGCRPDPARARPCTDLLASGLLFGKVWALPVQASVYRSPGEQVNLPQTKALVGERGVPQLAAVRLQPAASPRSARTPGGLGPPHRPALPLGKQSHRFSQPPRVPASQRDLGWDSESRSRP